MGQMEIGTWLDKVVVGSGGRRLQWFPPALGTWVLEDPVLPGLHLRLHRSRQSRMAMGKGGWCTNGLRGRIKGMSDENSGRFTG